MASNEFPVAVIGIACRIPHCENASQFWQFIRNKRESVGKFPTSRAEDVDHVLKKIGDDKLAKPNSPFFTGSFFDEIDKFDAQFFGISPQEAQFIDPQQRFFLRTAWEAFEDAGIAPEVYGSDIGVFVGNANDKYAQIITENHQSTAFGTHAPFIASRLSYTFDLKGPAFLVGIGCSSSLLAVHLAAQALRNGDCKTAIAGGVTLDCLPINLKSDVWNLLDITKEDVRCRPFDQNAKGTVKGEGCAAVVLKPLSEALNDNNHIYGVIVGSATNQNGRGNGLSTPHPRAQCDVMVTAWEKAQIDASEIDYFETHGTGTMVGDPIEMLGIQMAFDRSKSKKRTTPTKPCLGSVKANVGHLADGAAGVIGLIKVLLALENEIIPPQINFDTPNTSINWKKSPFRINTKEIEWKANEDKSRVAAVSSFGFVGTNVHLVVRDFKMVHESMIDDSVETIEPVMISAASQLSLKNFVKRLQKYLSSAKITDEKRFFKNLAYTLNVGRDHNKFLFRCLMFAKNIKSFDQKLKGLLEYLKLNEMKTVSVADEQCVRKALQNTGFLCFAIDSSTKIKHSSHQQSYFSNYFKLYNAIVNRESISWKKLEKRNRSFVPLVPTYCFDEQRFWPKTGRKLSDSNLSMNSAISFEEDYYSLSDEKHSSTSELKQDDLQAEFLNQLTSWTGLTFNDWESCRRQTLVELSIEPFIMLEIIFSLSNHFKSEVNLSTDDLKFSDTLEDIMELLKSNLNKYVTKNNNVVKSSDNGFIESKLKVCDLFLNFEMENESVKHVEKLFKNEIKVQKHSPHELIQSILNSSSNPDISLQILVLTDEVDEPLMVQLSEALVETEKTLKNVPLLILQLCLSSKTNISDKFKLVHRRMLYQKYEIDPNYHMLQFAASYYKVPFNNLGYEYVCSLIGRCIRAALFPSPSKIIAVDADNTLWDGECSNDVVMVNERHRVLQKFLVEKYEKGYLLVLLSKNTESDVENAFNSQKESLLITLDHFVAKKVNWVAKHKNLSDVCKSLNLSCDSVVFIDDNVAECISMVSQHPSVLSLCFPSTLNATRGLLENIWALDVFDTTNDGRRRSVYYRQESERKQTLIENSLCEVLKSWEMSLKIYTSNVSLLKLKHSEAYSRAQELLQRTNQFKMNTKAEDLMKFRDSKCLLINLEDKFGSYGMVSVVIFKVKNGNFIVEQWVISCRALGRNVEQNIFEHLQSLSKNLKCESILIEFERTEKNEPALNFLKELKCNEQCDSNGTKLMKCIEMSNANFVGIQKLHIVEPEAVESPDIETTSVRQNSKTNTDSTDFKENLDACKQWIKSWPNELKYQKRINYLNPALIEIEIEEKPQSDNNTENSVLFKAWCDILGSSPVNESHFFRSGGTSFKAVYFISKLREDLEIDIRLSHVYQYPTFGELRQLLKSLNSLTLAPIDPLTTSNEGKLSSIQNGFYMLQQVTPFSTAYTENVAVCDFFDEFNSEDVLKQLLQEFPYLTSVVDENENGDKVMSHLSVENLIRSCIEGVSVATKEVATRKAKYMRPYFKIENRTPLIKFLVFELTSDLKANKMVVLYVHHILVDDISLCEIEICLQQILRKQPITAKKSKRNFSDFANEERLYLNSQQIKIDLETMANSFEETPPNSCLGFSSEIWLDTKTFDSESKCVEIELNVNDVCESLDIRPFHYFLSCYILTLKRYLAENDILLHIPVTTRSHLYENAFGPFVNIVIFRYKLDPNCDLESFFHSVAEKWLSTQDINMLPHDSVIAYLRDNKKVADIALSNVFNYTTFAKNSSSAYIPPLHSKSPLYVNVRDNNQKVFITVEWSESFVDSHIVENFCRSFVFTCQSIARNFESIKVERLSSLDLISEEERETITNFNRPINNVPNIFVHRYFENHCRLNENKVVINVGGRSITYKQLNEMANKIAGYLQSVVKEVDLQKKPIVILMERNEMVLASILAIWKVGGYFLTVSEDMQQRVLQIYGDKKVTFDLILTNLTSDKIYVEVPSPLNVVNVCDLIKKRSFIPPFEDRIDIMDPKDTIAYIFLTSGTTGEPKRCMITHRSLSIFVEGCLRDYELQKFNVSLLQWLPICFDAFVHELVVGLLSVGGSITIVPHNQRFDVAKIGQLMIDHKISCCLVTPQFASSLVSELPKRALKHFRMLIVGGDVFYQNVYQELASKLETGTKIINVYGMTETTIDSTFFTGSLNYLTSSAQVPIGKPIIGVKMFIVDPVSKLLSPIGTIGEICISGELVGKGDIQTTTLYFTGDEPVFMTGDKARWLPDGNIDFIGRKTSTFFKIRGFRVNPREIELVVIKNVGSKIDQIRVFSAENRYGESILCLVYKRKSGVDCSDIEENIRNVIKSRLPYYMQPNIIKSVSEMPLTKNGKADINNLRKVCVMDKVNEMKMENLDTDLTATEAMIVKHLISSMSSSIPIDVNANFRDQGIHSLALMKLANVMVNEKVPGFKGVVDLFDYPNIKLLAQHIDAYHVTVSPKFVACPQADDCKIAIVGVSFRLPNNTTNIADLWNCLQGERCLVDEFPEMRSQDYLTRLSSTEFKRIKNIPKFKGAFLESIDKFDHEFFDIAPSEAKHMCPEQRLWIEVATEALFDSGHITNIRGRNFGIFMASSDVKYENVDSSNDAVSVVGKNPAFIPTRTSYHFDLKGPSVVVETACSSGIVALHQACDAIKSGNCDAAIVGGLNLILYPAKDGIFGEKMSTQSPDACCRAFDENANGTVPGEGVIAFVVEPLKKALEKNRFIYGVIESTAVNSVGRGNGITAPSVASQKEIIKNVISSASLSANDIQLIETHGSGTKLGDTIELTALKEVFADNLNPLYVCATKPTFGHLDGAAGLLGILKLITTFITKEIAPAVNFVTPNHVLEDSNLIVPHKAVKLVDNNLAGGVSAFGLSGTNSHVILSRQQSLFTRNNVYHSQHPLLICFFNIYELSKHFEQWYNYIKLMVIQLKVTNIENICATVCHQMRSLKKRKRNVGTRVVLMLENAEQAINLLEKLRHIDYEGLRDISEVDSHVIASKTGVNEALDSFIANGTVDNSLIDNYNEWNYSPSIPLSLFRSVRHWPEERNEEDVEIQTNHMNEKVCVKQLLEKQMLEVRELVHSVDLAPKPAVQDTIDRFAVAYIGRFFRECSFSQYWKVGKSFTTFEFFKLTNIHERYFSLFRAILKHLSKCGIIRSNEIIYDNLPVNFTILIGLNDDRFNEDPDAIAEYGIEAFPNHQDCFKLPLYCMKHFKDVVTGDLSPLTVLYPKGDLGFTSRHEMIGDPMGSIYMRKNIQTIAKYVKKLAKQSNNKIRVLEAGAGLGLITRQLVPKLCKLENVEYWFTDIGNAFVSHAEKLFSPISNRMKFHVFDITKPAAEQGIYEQFDVIVAYNVVHVTESLLQTAGNLCSTLNDTGVMFLLENTKNNIWATLTWGILDGWWFFKDYELRSEVLCTAENWERTLKKLDFQTIYSCPTNEDERRYVEKYMFVCCKENFEKLEDVEGWWEKVELRFEDTLIPKKQDDDEVNKLVKKLNYNEVVVLLKQIWKELLGVDAEDDDIFRDLGGESLLAIQMMFQVRDEIGVDLELAHCYAYPSLKELANFILTLIEQSMSNEHSEEENTSGVETELIETEVSVETSEVSDNENALLMFCGQGAHKDSMFNSLVKDEICMQVFNEAEQILGFDILEEFKNEENLQRTDFVQIALFVASVGKFRQIEKRNPQLLKNVKAVAGLSVGEFAALTFAGVLSFADALKLVYARGKAMQDLVDLTSTAMSSIVGPNTEQLSSFLTKNFPHLFISGYLADNQHTVSGDGTRIDEFLLKLKNDDVRKTLNLQDSRKLRVSGAFHTEFMESAAYEIEPVIDSITFSPPKLPVILNINGKATRDANFIKSQVKNQLINPLQWKQSIITAIEMGIVRFIELSPSPILTAIIRKRIKACSDAKCTAIFQDF